ncbi:hypothetical protein GH714_031119 [Hevea brasiliensis]|uniref:Uncharacterized protein n=1 Tax=Hevea brasiliensis TaxID=3981 RepID=A0A6A6NBW1_HEVBR|nr:hypothetical protein GH714_031119 [Hevea brasiliensis]
MVNENENVVCPDHCWLNRVEGEKDCFKEDGTFLVLAGQFFENSQIVLMIEKIKSLQRKYPELCVMGFHSGNSIGYAAVQAYLIELIMKEYITFPILLSNKNFLEESCIYHEKDLDLGMLNKGIEELNVQQIGNVDNENYSSYKLKSTWVKQAEGIKEPDFPSSLQNMLLYFPGCISADESSDRLFLSDSNHHRIIILDGNGRKIMDCIGSSPGFEDGEFESAKLLRPAGSFYHDAEDCLYIVDSEMILELTIFTLMIDIPKNQAIRRADMKRRVLETLYPTCSVNKNNSVWTWIANKVGFATKIDSKSKEFDSQLLVFPWHLLKSVDDSFLIINRSFETLWIMDLASGEIKECIKGFPKILETYGQLIMDKVSLLKQMPSDWLQRCINADSSPKVFPFASLISAVTTFHNLIVVCDTELHAAEDGLIIFNLSARCQVGVAQQWYDDLDNLAFSTPEYEITGEDGNTTSDVKSEDGRVHIDCAINTSPGTSEKPPILLMSSANATKSLFIMLKTF